MADPMTPVLDAVRREELRKLAEAATPGPWTWGAELICQKRADDTYKYLAEVPSGDYDSPRWNADAAYIAAMPPDTTLALLAYIAELEAERDELQAVFDGTLWMLDREAGLPVAYLTPYFETDQLGMIVKVIVSAESAPRPIPADWVPLAALLPKASVREKRDSHDINRKPTPEGK